MPKLTQEERDNISLRYRNYLFTTKEEVRISNIGDWWLSQIDKILEERDAQSYEAGRKAERDEIGKILMQEENDKWDDCIHCSCLGAAICEIFGEDYYKNPRNEI